MSEYIKREDAQRALVRTLKDAEIDTACNEQDWYCQGLMDAGVAIDAVPSADVVEVGHGHWQTDRYGNLLCSECKGFALYLETGCYVNRHMEQHKSDYCPNCGARMDGKEQEHE